MLRSRQETSTEQVEGWDSHNDSEDNGSKRKGAKVEIVPGPHLLLHSLAGNQKITDDQGIAPPIQPLVCSLSAPMQGP